jgi:hypothetical protein
MEVSGQLHAPAALPQGKSIIANIHPYIKKEKLLFV